MLDECKLTDEPELQNEMNNVTKQFGDIFEKVDEELKKLALNKETNTQSIILIGNTGAGKSTLGQLITNGENLQSVEVTLSDYIISDGDKIGTETVVSKTLYPNLLIDPETGVVICDSPGFKDTRSPVHELIAAFSIKNVVKQMKSVKIVLVVNHASLKKGSYRADFTNLLEQTVYYVKDIDKYKDSIYLVATKAENTIRMTASGEIELTPDETMIKGMYHFLQETKSSLQHSASIKNDKVPQMIKLIDCFLQLRKPDFVLPQNIKIFRKPNNAGPLMEIDIIRRERLEIRDMLLSKANFTEKNDNDFDYSISATAELYINDFFSFSNKFMTSLSNKIANYLTQHYNRTLNKIDNVNNRLTNANMIKSQVIKFGIEIGKSAKPSAFAGEVETFSQSNNISYGCKLNLKGLNLLENYINYLENISNDNTLVESRWNSSIKSVIDFLGTEIDNYKLSADVVSALSEYDFQRRKGELVNLINQWEKEDTSQNAINENTFIPFLEKIDLDTDYKSLKPNVFTMKMLNRAVKLHVSSEIKIVCEKKTLQVIGFIIKISDIDDNHFKSCNGFQNFVIFAMNTLFIDRDLEREELAGKQVIIIAPTWHTIGTRIISVDGKSGKYLYQPKAYNGNVGKNGKNGGNGGIVMGVAEVFVNGNNLLVTANGGDGQNGQDGGDGSNGYDGSDGVYYSSRLSDNNKAIYVVYNNYEERSVYEGTRGTRGGNSGGGGLGGLPGAKGTVTLLSSPRNDYQNGQFSSSSSGVNEVSIKAKDGARGKNGADGTPGRGGKGGCDIVHTYRSHYALFIPVSKSRDVSRGSCYGRSDNGYVVHTTNYFRWSLTTSETLEPFEKCQVISDYNTIYEQEYKSLRYNELTTSFINNNFCT